MEKSILINLVYPAIILPVIWLVVDKSQNNWRKNIGLFSIYFFLYQIVLLAPSYVAWLRIDRLDWNWSGKVLAILFSLGFYYKFKNHFSQHLFIKIRPQLHLKSNLIILFIVSVIALVEGILFYNQGWDTETILFQLTLPGIDEEIAYRGIMLGLFASITRNKVTLGKFAIHNPSIWICGILFGLIHALKFKDGMNLNFDLLYFTKTFILGTIWSYMTLKAKSILLPILSHNLSNSLANLVGMLK
ncbi:MAG: CPBP family intramembrane metalloprotease [Cytophagales bacterium]|nr:CPBP family intramembrane metalloprotease [Cytophagales bacterium]